jgi:hypothetical protein
MQSMETQNMVVGLPEVIPPKGVYKGYILGKHHQEPFDSRKVWKDEDLMELVQSDV